MQLSDCKYICSHLTAQGFSKIFLKNQEIACKDLFNRYLPARCVYNTVIDLLLCHTDTWYILSDELLPASLRKKIPDLQVSSDLVKGNKNLPAGSE